MVFRLFKSSAITFFVALLFLCLLLTAPSLSQRTTPSLNRPAYNQFNSSFHTKPVEGKLHIVAVMVEFEEDDNRFTTGTGSMSNAGMPFLNDPSIRIDPLPHNQQYFEAHLEFAKNYYETVSNGVLEIEYTVVPEVVKLTGRMEQYSPTGRDLDFLPVAEMAAETWNIVNKQNLITSLPRSDNEIAFIIFHAGSGRDIELPGTALNKTPQDIPSVYLNRNSFINIFNDPAFEGFPLDSAEAIISNTLILPRTLSRPGEDITGSPFVLQLSINGLVTAQIGSHIGLPDLFDTKSGLSGIGRFGLMDGAGIFSYSGLFPPEMSAWEKVFLGWSEPVTLQTDSEITAEIPAAVLRQKDSIMKIELSESEYFLIENRHRDPAGDGITIDIQKPDGSIVSQTFSNSNTDFTFQQDGFEQNLEPGVLISVSNYDFSLPGGLFEENNNSQNFRELNGGILIWHIDENIIAERIRSNTINTGPAPNGVTLMEADGAQDIGNPVTNGLFSNESNGWAFDFWWKSNDASVITQSNTIQLYENKFGPDTTPDNNSNSGAFADFELINFSENLPVSSFTLRTTTPFPSLYSKLNTSQLRNLSVSPFTIQNRYWGAYPLSIQPVTLKGDLHYLIPGSDGIELLNPRTISLLSTRIQQYHTIQQPLWNNEAQQLTLAESPEENDQIVILSYKVEQQTFEQLWVTESISNNGFISQSEPEFIDLDHTSEKIRSLDGTVVRSMTDIQQSDQISGISSKIDHNQLTINYPEGDVSHSIPEISESQRKHTGIIYQTNGEIYIYLLLDTKLLLFKKSDFFKDAELIHEGDEIGWPAFGDINSDGFTDILYVNYGTNKLVAKSVSGALLPFFPIDAPSKTTFMGTPLLSDLNGNGNLNIVIQTESNLSVSLHAFDNRANLIDGFPLLIGGGAANNIEPIHPAIFEQYLVAVSPDGDVNLWMFPKNKNTVWGTKYGNGTNNKVSANVFVDAPAPLNSDLIIYDETYNWPNPAKNFTTIRFFTSETANVDIDIISASGKKVFSKSVVTGGAIAEEITIDTSNWASGAYFARVKASGAKQTEQKTIRIAIAR